MKRIGQIRARQAQATVSPVGDDHVWATYTVYIQQINTDSADPEHGARPPHLPVELQLHVCVRLLLLLQLQRLHRLRHAGQGHPRVPVAAAAAAAARASARGKALRGWPAVYIQWVRVRVRVRVRVSLSWGSP